MRPIRATFLAAITLLIPGCIVIVNGDSSDGGSAKFKATRSIDVPGALVTTLNVETVNGAIHLHRKDGSTTTIVADLRAQSQDRLDKIKIVADRKPDGAMKISVAWPGGHANPGEGCSLDITLPNSPTSIHATSTDGAITAESLAGFAKFESSNGKIEVTNHAGCVEARTSNGAIVLHQIAGDADAHTSNGKVEITGVDGKATAHTSNGAVDLTLSDKSPGPVNVETSNGAVYVCLSKSFVGALSLNTSNGGLHYTPSSVVTAASINKSSAHLTVGHTDSPKSSVETSNGSIDLRFAE